MASGTALTTYLHRLTEVLPPTLRQNPRAAAIAVAITALGVSIPTLSYARASYRGYIALGKGGMPYNVFGWALQGVLQLIARHDTRDPLPLAKPQNRTATEPHGNKTFFSSAQVPIPERQGGRPEVPGYVAPQRQMTQRPSDVEAMRARMAAHLVKLAAKGAGVLVMRPSGLEGVGTQALWLDTRARASSASPPLPKFLARGLKGEVTHVHPEASSHITLSMADAEEVVRKGWAERHPLSGVAFMPWSYVMIYAPRDEAELEVWKAIMSAGVRFVCAAAGREVNLE
ncbi:hypothetical protein M406DRAFT_258562 [Cryphonectria parasitica EP155]|uniref:Luciferase domain-containing protein n=1 Tax=Cryphonectria parasitica (strain ATCC 38755 / EP155) TaxID=660469 RepID=A0A9P4Y0Z2_CRYP1|nr:uncharacterized protein M406DRAFT_258562 [Cryphonectria parasitica EP155]KAF3764382.1 hypothetical protein M406DRAFT_258562 [Cryphonectria parasitica EP155]